MKVTSAPLLAAAIGMAASLAACGASSGAPPPATPASTASSTTSSTTPSTSTAGPTSTTVPPTTVPPTTTTTSVVGLVVNATGTTLTAPGAPTVKPYSPDCRTLIDRGFSGTCLVAASRSGTIAAIVERKPGPEVQERDLVYLRRSAYWDLDLRRVRISGPPTELWRDDIMRNGDVDAVFVVPSTDGSGAEELDVVGSDGLVSLYRQLQGGFAVVPAAGGLVTYVPAPGGGYDRATVDQRSGAWRIVAASHISASTAAAAHQGPFSGPEAFRSA